MRYIQGIVSSTIIAVALVGCAGKAKKEQALEHAKQESKTDDLKPNVDYEKASRLYIELGLAYLKDGQVGRAKEKLLRAKKLAPELAEVHYALGYYKESVGEIDQAKDHYLEAIRKKPKNGLAHNNYGAFLCRQGHYQEAEKEFLVAVEDPEYTTPAEALENAGLCLMQIPDIARAQEHLERSVRMDPKRFSAILELSMINYQNKHYSTSLEYHSLYAQQADHTPRSLWLGIKLAEHYQDQKRLQKYKQILKEKFPQSAERKYLEKNTS